MIRLLILYYSRHGSTRNLATAVSAGAMRVQNTEVLLRTVPAVSPETRQVQPEVPDEGEPYVTLEDLATCDGLALGSPTRFGNMAAPLKYFLDSSSPLWLNGALVNKPFALFTSTSSLHGGQESTLLSMALPLMHQGMIWVGVPYTSTAMANTRSGGTPYGASHVAWNDKTQLSEEEREIAMELGERLARTAHACKEL